MLTGSCLCGAVAYEVDAPAAPIVFCNFQTCRKAHGSAFAAGARRPIGPCSGASSPSRG